MKTGIFSWRGRDVHFRNGESIAAALEAAGVISLGSGGLDQESRYFCGIGACQGCLVRVDGAIREACLTRASEGCRVEALGDSP